MSGGMYKKDGGLDDKTNFFKDEYDSFNNFYQKTIKPK